MATNTRPVPNLNAAMVDGGGFLKAPWMQWFQQFVQKAAAIQDVTSLGSPYTANQNGTVIVSGASAVTLGRGSISINLNLNAGQVIIPISIGDSVFYTGAATVQFLGA